MHAHLQRADALRPDLEADWKAAHEALVHLAHTQRQHDFEEARWILAAFRNHAHSMLGHASFLEYLEHLFGYTARQASERLRVAEALAELPRLARSLQTGELNWSAVRELSRVAMPYTEDEWIDVARDKTMRQIEQLVSGHAPGDRPSDPAGQPTKKVLRFEVAPETHALVIEALAKVRRDSGGALSDDDALLEMARQVLRGPADDGRSSYQVVITRCPECRKASAGGAAEEMAECDAQHVEIPTHVGEERPRASQTIPPAVRREIKRRDGDRCAVSGCRNKVWVDVHHVRPRSEGGGHNPEQLLLLCGAHHRQVHEGRLLIEGSASSGFTFRHADGTRYGGEPNPHRASAMAEAFDALIALGFKQGEAQRALDEVRAHVGASRPIATAQDAVLMALRFLRHA